MRFFRSEPAPRRSRRFLLPLGWVAALVVIGCGRGGPAGDGRTPASGPDPFAGRGPGVRAVQTLNGRRLLWEPDGPIVLEVTVANRTDEPVRVLEPLVPGPVDHPRLTFTVETHTAQPERDIDGEIDWKWGRVHLYDEGPKASDPPAAEGPHREDTVTGPTSQSVVEMMTPAGQAAAGKPSSWTAVPPGGRIVRRFRLDRLYRLGVPRRIFRLAAEVIAEDESGAAVGVTNLGRAWEGTDPAIITFADPRPAGAEDGPG